MTAPDATRVDVHFVTHFPGNDITVSLGDRPYALISVGDVTDTNVDITVTVGGGAMGRDDVATLFEEMASVLRNGDATDIVP